MIGQVVYRLLLGSACFLLLASPVRGQKLPPVNLGSTSFLDGGVPAGSGFYFQQYMQLYTADRFNDSRGREVSGFPDLDIWLSLTQLSYLSDQEVLFGGKWALDLLVPFVLDDFSFDDDGTGFGDITFGPALQWDPILVEEKPIFVHRLELQWIFPTGRYSDGRMRNPGSNVFSFNPYWAGTVFLTPKWTTSWRLHYLWNSENDDPIEPLFPGARDTQAGQAIHLNFATAYEVLPKRLHLGVNGYYLTQITDSKIDGSSVSGGGEQVLGIGPGAVYHFSLDHHLFLNTYFETAAENRPEGIHLVLRYVFHF